MFKTRKKFIPALNYIAEDFLRLNKINLFLPVIIIQKKTNNIRNSVEKQSRYFYLFFITNSNNLQNIEATLK